MSVYTILDVLADCDWFRTHKLFDNLVLFGVLPTSKDRATIPMVSEISKNVNINDNWYKVDLAKNPVGYLYTMCIYANLCTF